MATTESKRSAFENRKKRTTIQVLDRTCRVCCFAISASNANEPLALQIGNNLPDRFFVRECQKQHAVITARKPLMLTQDMSNDYVAFSPCHQFLHCQPLCSPSAWQSALQSAPQPLQLLTQRWSRPPWALQSPAGQHMLSALACLSSTASRTVILNQIS